MLVAFENENLQSASNCISRVKNESPRLTLILSRNIRLKARLLNLEHFFSVGAQTSDA